MGTTVAVAGASGYAGGEVLRLLATHPEFEIGAVTAHSNAGARLGEHHSHLTSLADRTFEPTTADRLSGHDVVVLALPHGASGEISAQLPDEVLVLDCGADHRLTSKDAWKHFYGTEYAGAWPYGLPELLVGPQQKQRDRLADARRIAVPGCNVTAVTLAMAPGVAAGVVAPDDIVAVLACGPSGAGKSLKAYLLASEIMGAASPYAVGGVHRHIPEIEQNLSLASGGSDVSISFTPTLVPMSRGILATVTAKLTGRAAAARAAWEAAYSEEPFVHVLPEGQWPTTAAVLGANAAHIQVAVDERAGRVVAVAAIDNLVKGTAGAAVQCANIALGLPEMLGLGVDGVAP